MFLVISSAKFSSVFANQNFQGLSDAESLLELIKTVIEEDWESLGVGRIAQGTDETYFIVVNWPSAQSFRQKIGLPPKDFHITLGCNSVRLTSP